MKKVFFSRKKEFFFSANNLLIEIKSIRNNFSLKKEFIIIEKENIIRNIIILAHKKNILL